MERGRDFPNVTLAPRPPESCPCILPTVNDCAVHETDTDNRPRLCPSVVLPSISAPWETTKPNSSSAAAPAPANKDKATHQLQTHLDLAVPWATDVQIGDGPELHSSIPQCPGMTSHLCLKNLTQDKTRALNSSQGTWFQERSSGFHRSTETKVYRDRF